MTLVLVAIEVPLLALMWAIAVSGFWNGSFLWSGLATGTAACALAALVTGVIVAAAKGVRT